MGPLLDVRDLTTCFDPRWGSLAAVDGVSLTLEAGETLGVVGESGSGKSMLAMSLVRLVPQPAGRIAGGSVMFDGRDLLSISEAEIRRVRGAEISMILQDPMSSLNPLMTVGDQVGEAIRIHRGLSGRTLRDAVIEALTQVRIPSPEIRMRNWPHELSGGMRQRVVGAIAIACRPKLLIADEPTTALDATVQLQYLDLLRDLQKRFGMALMMITHDFGVVAHMCDRAAVMYAGRIVEMGPVVDLFERPAHPYTQGLLRSLPQADRKVERLPGIEGVPPQLSSLPTGCRFAPRCPKATEQCREAYPPVVQKGLRHEAACWHAD